MSPRILFVLCVTSITGSMAAQADLTPYPLSRQTEAGHWSPVDFGDNKPPSGVARDLRVTSLVCLQFIAGGNPIRKGPQKKSLVRGIRWLRRQQDKSGRFGFHTEPDWILDHSLACYTMAEVSLNSPSKLLRKPTEDALRVIAKHFDRVKSAPVELLLWSQLAADTSACVSRLEFKDDDPESSQRLAGVVKSVHLGIAGLLPNCVLATARERAAALWLRVLRDPKLVDKQLAKDLKAALQDLTVLDASKPLQTLYLVNLAFLVGGKTWKRASRAVRNEILIKQYGRGWEARGEFARTDGRIGVSAVNALTLAVYYSILVR